MKDERNVVCKEISYTMCK